MHFSDQSLDLCTKKSGDQTLGSIAAGVPSFFSIAKGLGEPR
jgi:hypothetical protein